MDPSQFERARELCNKALSQGLSNVAERGEAFALMSETLDNLASAAHTTAQLIGVLHHVIVDNELHKRHGEDTIGVLMKCGAFHCADETDKGFVAAIATAVDAYEPKIKLGR